MNNKSIPLVAIGLFVFVLAAMTISAQSPELPNSEGAGSGEKSGAPADVSDAYVPRTFGQTYYERGDEAWGKEDFLEAAYWYRRWIEAAPQSPFTWYMLASCHARLGNQDAALGAFETAVDAGLEGRSEKLKDEDLKSIRDHPRFRAAIERMPEEDPDLSEAPKPETDGESAPAYVLRRSLPQVTAGTYLLYVPPRFALRKDRETVPVCVILHGQGSTEWDHGSLSEDMGREHAVYVAVRSPYWQGEGETEGYTVNPPFLCDDMAQANHPLVQFADFVQNCVDDAKKALKLPADGPVKVLGHSQGAISALVYACRYSDKVSSCFVYAGMLPGRLYSDYPDPLAIGSRPDGMGGIANAKRSTFVIGHCHDDDVIAIRHARGMLDKLFEHGITGIPYYMSEGGHGFPEDLIKVLGRWVKGEKIEQRMN